MITPAPGYIIDPNNPNGVIRDPNVAIAPGGLPTVTPQPVVAPGATGSLQGTMTSAPTGGATPPITPPTPVAPAAPAAPVVPGAPTPAPVQGNDFTSILNSVQDKLKYNNTLTDQRALLMKHLFDSPLTPDQIAQLPPDVQKVVASGNKDAIELQVRVLNDELQGRANTLDKSIQYLTSTYQADQENLDKKKQDAVSNVLNFAQVYGSKAPSVLKSLYGQDYLDQLKTQGIDLDSFIATPTLAETAAKAKAAAAGDGGTGVSPSSPYAGVIATILGSGKFTAAQAKAITNAINNGDDPLTVVKNNAKNIMGSADSTQLSKLENASKALNDINKELGEFYAAGGKTNLVSGKLSDVANKFGSVTDPKLTTLATEIKTSIQAYRNAISGTAYSEQEGQDINSIFPGISNSKTLNDAIVKGRQTTFDSQIDAAYGTAIGDQTYQTLKNLDTANDPVASLKQQLEPGEILVSREASDGRHYVAITPDELWATDIKL